MSLASEHVCVNPDFKPLGNVCEFLTALHIYAEEARSGKTRVVEATHFCSHVRKDLRQCLIYDSARPDARLIGVEYMIPKHIYEKLDGDEQKLWHSHEFEVSSGMLILPKPSSIDSHEEWDKTETEAMKEIAGLYGKTFHTWQIDRGDEIPLGMPTLMGSLTEKGQIDLDKALENRNREFGVDHKAKAALRAQAGVNGPGLHENADCWWKGQ